MKSTEKERLIKSDILSIESQVRHAFNQGYDLGYKEGIKKQPKTGHWEWVQYDYNPKIGNWHCSECRSVVVECVSKEEKGGIPFYKYCPQCGTKMSEIPTGSDPQESEKVN